MTDESVPNESAPDTATSSTATSNTATPSKPAPKGSSETGLQDLDLTPQVTNPGVGSRSRMRNRLIVGSIVLVLAFVLFKAITSASVFFYNVDEAVAEQFELGDRTFRMQGVVVSEPVKDSSGIITFEVSFNDVNAEIRHIGEEPTDLFEIGMPVVIEGHWDGRVFESSQILVKHSETYIADNGENEERPGVGDNGVLK